MADQVHALQLRPAEYDYAHEASKPPQKDDNPTPDSVGFFMPSTM